MSTISLVIEYDSVHQVSASKDTYDFEEDFKGFSVYGHGSHHMVNRRMNVVS